VGGGSSGKAAFFHGLARGQVLAVEIESLAAGGHGVARANGVPVFVARVAPGDLAEIELVDVRKDFARGRLLKVLERSEQRVEPPCKLFKICGGCQWQHISYDRQLEAKTDLVRQAVKRIGGLDPGIVGRTIAAAEPFFYRNKVQFPVAHPRGSTRILAGYYEQDSHDLVNIKHCPVQPEPLDRVLEATKDLCQQYKISAYDETKGAGLLRHITARFSFDRREALVTLVVNAATGAGGRGRAGQVVDLDVMRALAGKIIKRVPEVAGVCLNFNPDAGNRIFGDKTICLAGEPYVSERLATRRPDLPARLRDGFEFRLSPTSFFQVHTDQASRLMELVVEAAVPGPPGEAPLPLVVDAYAGVGAIAFWLSTVACRVLAVEEHAQAVADGQVNRELNGIENVEFRCGAVESVLPQLAASGLNPQVIVLDPPRKGLSPEAMAATVALRPARIVYVSCNPATLARDLKILVINGYMTKQVQPIDMFPQTYHVESVAVLERRP